MCPPFILGRNPNCFEAHQPNEEVHIAQATAAYLAALEKENHL